MKLPGHRIVKTTVAVFVTAYICVLLHWPPVFAVITAIVTLEPSVHDSIKKGMVRFPASAIGSFYAVLFIALFGNSPITYTLAASLTIITCFQLRLHTGLLVATITAVAMVEVVYDNYLMSFFVRLGTTTTGILVSTLVNMFVLPPNYTKIIEEQMKQVYTDLGDTLIKLANLHNKQAIKKKMVNIQHKIDKLEELTRFQKEQSYFQFFIIHKKEEEPQEDEGNVQQLKLIHYHLRNITNLEMKHMTFSDENMLVIKNAIHRLANILQDKEIKEEDQYEIKLRKLLDLFWNSPHPAYKEEEAELPHELTLLYELVTIFYIVKQSKSF